ncbi:chemoreceptor glutamine deamidase CheD [Thiotrichales bacterium HSG1]|nr:chemoreceptor glutamine deamidase CheD [Thiotrichales bacterium HSG1]
MSINLPNALPGYKHIKRYWDHRSSGYVAKILPGEYYVTYHNEILMTVVGSCVSACICDKNIGIGGMNHFMLPHGVTDKWAHTSASAASRYGSVAMEYLINEILKHGGRKENLEIKLFGGGRIMQNIGNIGQQNIDFVRNYIEMEGLNLSAEDLGDIYPRKILFFPNTGLARVKKLRATQQIVLERETEYRHNLESQSTAGDVDLF